jgi:hypothetical protein
VGALGFRRSPAPFISTDNRNPYGNGFWAVEFSPAIFNFGSNNFMINHIYLEGPTGSQFRVFVNQRPYSTSSRGDNNEWDPNNPLFMIGGQSLIFYWNSAGTPQPLVVVSCATPTP